MLRVGLTGGIGSGKSEASRRLAALGAVVIDADQAARAVVEPGTPGLARIAEAFGPGVLRADGALDRPKLGELVFADEKARARLNAIVHPLVHEWMRSTEQTAAGAVGDDAIVIHDVPLLAEGGSQRSAEFDLIIVVDVPPEVQVERLAATRGMKAEHARARMAAQATREHRIAIADIVIDNSGTLADLDKRVARVWQDLQARRDRLSRRILGAGALGSFGLTDGRSVGRAATVTGEATARPRKPRAAAHRERVRRQGSHYSFGRKIPLALAGELVAQSGQRFVRGQGSAGGAGFRARAAAAAAARAAAGCLAGGRLGRTGPLGGLGALFFCLGAGLLDLAAVRLEAGAGLGVLPLPLLTLRVVAWQPFARLRVETLRVLVVALVVVGGGHAVQGRVEVVADGLADRALVGLLEREADAAPVQVDVDDLDEDLLAHLHDLLGDLHVAVSQLGDVHQALDAFLHADEGAERDELGDPAG